jgi:hypothetical protein
MSNLKLKFTPQSFEAAVATLGSKSEMAIGHNTRLELSYDGSVYATYHGNRIVRYSPDGVEASWAGWTSNTTTNRLNMLAPARFNIKNFTPHLNGEPVASSGWHKVS